MTSCAKGLTHSGTALKKISPKSLIPNQQQSGRTNSSTPDVQANTKRHLQCWSKSGSFYNILTKKKNLHIQTEMLPRHRCTQEKTHHSCVC